MEKKLMLAGSVLGVAFAVLGLLAIFGKAPSPLASGADGGAELPPPDTPPIEFAYLDATRADAYLGQAEGGLADSEQRTEQLTRSLNASLSAGSVAQVGGSAQEQDGTVATITPQAADRFYTFLRVLRNHGEADYHNQNSCVGGRKPGWLGEVDDEWEPKRVMDEVECTGVGNFVRIHHAQLFLPPFAQALPKLQSTNAFYGALPTPRTAFTSPEQSLKIAHALSGYAKLVGPDARLPFVASPYGLPSEVGHGVTIFLPADYAGITVEPSLLSGSVTIVGEVVYSAGAGEPYIDYPTVATYGRALLEAQPALRNDLGVCAEAPPPPTRARALSVAQRHAHETPGRSSAHAARCMSKQQTLYDIKKSATFKAPVVVVLPLAIYG